MQLTFFKKRQSPNNTQSTTTRTRKQSETTKWRVTMSLPTHPFSFEINNLLKRQSVTGKICTETAGACQYIFCQEQTDWSVYIPPTLFNQNYFFQVPLLSFYPHFFLVYCTWRFRVGVLDWGFGDKSVWLLRFLLGRYSVFTHRGIEWCAIKCQIHCTTLTHSILLFSITELALRYKFTCTKVDWHITCKIWRLEMEL